MLFILPLSRVILVLRYPSLALSWSRITLALRYPGLALPWSCVIVILAIPLSLYVRSLSARSRDREIVATQIKGEWCCGAEEAGMGRVPLKATTAGSAVVIE